MILIIAVYEILQNSTAFENAECFAVFVLVCEGGDAAVGVNFQEPRLLLLILRHLDSVDLFTRQCCSVGKEEVSAHCIQDPTPQGEWTP